MEIDKSDKFCLKWNEFESNISGAFKELREDKDFFDVTLACEDEQMQAHKVILSACSPFFRGILRRNKHEHPLLYLKGVKYADLVSVLNFMYQGEVNVAQEELNSFLAVAEDLRVRGLSQNNEQPRNKHPTRTRNFNDPAGPTDTKQVITKNHKPTLPPASNKFQNENPEIQEIVPVKSEPFPTETALVDQRYPDNIQQHNTTIVNQKYSTSIQQFNQGGVMTYTEDYGEYEAYEEADNDYSNTLPPDENNALDDLIAQSMSQILDETGSKLWNCDLCHRSNKSKQEIRRHMESHLQVQHQCPHCEKQVQTREALRRHISRYHKF